MSEFTCPVVQIGTTFKHPNADRLCTTDVEGCPVLFASGQFKTGDLAVYLPVDAIVPLSGNRFAFLRTEKRPKERHRIRAKKLRGIFSMGLLIPAEPGMALGEDVASRLDITKYEEILPLNMQAGGVEEDPGFMPVYEMESYRKYKDAFKQGEEVVVTEKLHGSNVRCCWKEDRLWVGSHKMIRKQDAANFWWKVAFDNELATKLQTVPGVVLYGEAYGRVQDLHYDTKANEIKFAAFDAFDTEARKFLNYDDFIALCQRLNLPTVPVLYRGPYSPDIIEPQANGLTVLGGKNIREGFVIKPTVEQRDSRIGRVILKLISEEYLLRADGTEHH